MPRRTSPTGGAKGDKRGIELPRGKQAPHPVIKWYHIATVQALVDNTFQIVEIREAYNAIGRFTAYKAEFIPVGSKPELCATGPDLLDVVKEATIHLIESFPDFMTIHLRHENGSNR